MHFILPYFIIFIIVIQLFLKKNSKKNTERNQDFWDRESQSNAVRKKDISSLDYILIPDSLKIPDTQDKNILHEWEVLSSLKDEKILNLTGISNTELKLTYGTANLSVLTHYDNNFTKLCQCIIKMSRALQEAGYTEESVPFLEYGISIGSDIKQNYKLLCDYYTANNMTSKISELYVNASTLNSLMKEPILDMLKSYL